MTVVAIYQGSVAVIRALHTGIPDLPLSRFVWESGAGAVLLVLLAVSFWATVAGTGGLWAVPHVAVEEECPALGQPLIPGVCCVWIFGCG